MKRLMLPCQLFLLLIFIGNILFSGETLAQGEFTVLHRRIYMGVNLNRAINPFLEIEVGPPWYLTAEDTLEAKFLLNPFSWEPTDSIDAFRAFVTQPQTLNDYYSIIKFHFGYRYIDLDYLIEADSLLNIQYQIVDANSLEIVDVALEIEATLFTKAVFDSMTFNTYQLHYIEGTRTHTFLSYPGQQVYTQVDINWPVLKDSIEYGWGLTQTWGYYSDSSDFGKNDLPRQIVTTGLINSTRKINSFQLHQNYPNPFNHTTIISFDLPSHGYVNLSIYNMAGQKIITLINEPENAGSHRVRFDASSLAAGCYFYKLNFNGTAEIKKMLYMK